MRRLFVPVLLALVFGIAPRIPGLRTSPTAAAVTVQPQFVARQLGPVITTDGPLEDLLGIEEEKPAKLADLVKPTLAAGEKWALHLRLANTEVNDKTVKDMIARIEQANAAAVDYIVLELNTPGGSVSAGRELVRQIEMSPAPVICVADGEAASMGFYILQGCDYRLMTSRSYLMVHEPGLSMIYSGQQTQWRNLAEDMKATSEAMLYHEAARLKISRSELSWRIAHGQSWYMNVDEAKRVGAVDAAVKSVRDVVASYQHSGKPPR